MRRPPPPLIVPPPTAPANMEVGSIKLASPRDAPAPKSSIPVCTPSVTDSTAAPVPPRVTPWRIRPPLPANSIKSLAGPRRPNPNVARSATVSILPAARPPRATRDLSTSSSVPPSAIARSPAWPYIPPVDCPTLCVNTPAVAPRPSAVILSPILSPSKSFAWSLITASTPSVTAFLAIAAPIPPLAKAPMASGRARPA